MASLQVQRLEADVHIKTPAKQFFDVFCSRTFHIANVCPEKVQGVEIRQGQWGSQGSIIFWNYVHDGKKCVAKELVELIDKENCKMTFKVLEGDLMEQYKSYIFKLQVFPQEKGSVARWTMEYEKLNDQTPDPHSLLQLDINLTKEIDTHLSA